MNYPFANADWYAKHLPQTRLYRKVSVGLLTLGHLRTAEALGVGFLCGADWDAVDWGLLISVAQSNWRKAVKRSAKPNAFWILRRDRNAPRNADELDACIKWFKKQNYFPTRTLLKSEETERLQELSQLSKNRASSDIERLAMAVCRVKGWQTLTNCDCVWDVPMVSATHVLVANAELEGAYHIPYDLIKMAVTNG